MSSPALPATTCVFCTLPAARIRLSSPLALALDDAYPVSPGHMLIIPRRLLFGADFGGFFPGLPGRAVTYTSALPRPLQELQ